MLNTEILNKQRLEIFKAVDFSEFIEVVNKNPQVENIATWNKDGIKIRNNVASNPMLNFQLDLETRLDIEKGEVLGVIHNHLNIGEELNPSLSWQDIRLSDYYGVDICCIENTISVTANTTNINSDNINTDSENIFVNLDSDWNDLINILSYQKNLLATVIKEIKPEINKNWLDLGCGKCKLYYLIKDEYSPRKYLGIDNDISLLSKKYHLIDETNNLVNLFPTNLKDIWDKIILWNSFNWSIKYDYIIANFSIMHFWSDLFWEQLNKITKTGSIFIFNIVKENINWNYKDSYINSDTVETKIYFTWTHTKEHKETIISDQVINNTISKYGWQITNKLYFDDPLCNCYNWYILTKE
jgi:hypothetical protein